MKDIVGVVLMIAMIFGGKVGFKHFHNTVRSVALEKTSEGLPSLTQMTRSLQKQKGSQGGIKQ